MHLVTIPARYCQRAGIQIDSAWLDQVIAICERFGVKVSSGHRTKAQNDAAGGADDSDHLRGDAVDFVGSARALADLYAWAQGRFPYIEPMTQAVDHVHISFQRAGASLASSSAKKTLVPLGGMAFVRALKTSCERHDMGWVAVAAVGMQEGSNGLIGDSGSSYGPWQLHIGGALPKRWARLGKSSQKTQAWAWSAAGIEYAVAGMAAHGAAGKRRDAAVHAIVYGFEHPRRPLAEYTSAVKAVDYINAGTPTPEARVAAWFGGPRGGVPGGNIPPSQPTAPVQAPKARAAWASLMATLARGVPAQTARTRQVAARLAGTVK